MAFFHFHSSVGKRSAGQSSVASASYRAGEMLVDERTGVVHDYQKKGGIIEKMILLPDNAPRSFQDRGKLWNEVEKVEKRKDAQVYREFELALPSEMTDEQRSALVKAWVEKNLVSRGMVADVCIHRSRDKKTKKRGKNYHAHILCTLRKIDDSGKFGKKEREWNERELICSLRKDWAETLTKSMNELGINETFSERSYRDRGIEREPQIHHGGFADRIEVNEQIRERNAERDALTQTLDSLDKQIAQIEKSAQTRQRADSALADLLETIRLASEAKAKADAEAERKKEEEKKPVKVIEIEKTQETVKADSLSDKLVKQQIEQAQALAQSLKAEADALLAQQQFKAELERKAEAERERIRAQNEQRFRDAPMIQRGEIARGKIEAIFKEKIWLIDGKKVPVFSRDGYQLGDEIVVQYRADGKWVLCTEAEMREHEQKQREAQQAREAVKTAHTAPAAPAPAKPEPSKGKAPSPGLKGPKKGGMSM